MVFICSFLLFLKMSLIYSFYGLVKESMFCSFCTHFIINGVSLNLLLIDHLSHFNTYFISTTFVNIYFPNTFIFILLFLYQIVFSFFIKGDLIFYLILIFCLIVFSHKIFNHRLFFIILLKRHMIFL